MQNADDSPVAPTRRGRSDATLFRTEAVDAYRNPRSTLEPPEVHLTFPALWLWSGLLVIAAASSWLVALPVQSAHDVGVTGFARCANDTVAFQFAPKRHIREDSVSMLIADRAYSEPEFLFATKPLRCVEEDGTAVTIGGEPTAITVLLPGRTDAASELTVPATVTVVIEESLWSMLAGTNVGSDAASG